MDGDRSRQGGAVTMTDKTKVPGRGGERSRPLFPGAGRAKLDFLPGRLVVRFAPEQLRDAAPQRASIASLRSAVGALSENVRGPLNYLAQSVGLQHIAPLFAESEARRSLRRIGPAREAAGLTALTSVAHSMNEDLQGYAMVKFDPKRGTKRVIEALKGSRAVTYAEPVAARWLTATPAAVDPNRNLQWGLRAINWFSAKLPGELTRKIGIIDTGVDEVHPDLAGLVDHDAYHVGPYSRADLLGHGTHVAGIIAAISNNSIGIAGVAQSKLEVWKVFPDKPDPGNGEFYVDPEAFQRALGQAVNAGVSVVNLSLGGTERDATEELLIRRLIDRGVAVVAAMGNEYEDGNPVEFPAAFPGVIAIGAVNELMRRASFSNTGRHISISAPGKNILSTLPLKSSPYRDETEYASWDGTSMATPHVTAAIGMMRQRHSALDVAAVKAKLESSAQKVPAMKGKTRTGAHGSGVLDLEKALL
jgi:hypothetical protein